MRVSALIPPPRIAFWVSVLLAFASLPFNVIFVLYSWAAVARIVNPYFADNNAWAVWITAGTAHLALYLFVLLLVQLLLRRGSPQARSVATLVTSILYSACVLWVLMAIGPIDL